MNEPAPSTTASEPAATVHRTRRLVLAVAALLALALGMWAGWRSSGPAQAPPLQAATVLPAPRALGGIQLIADDGQTLTEQQLRGQWTFVFIGYTHCPDVCPATMRVFQDIARALEKDPPPSGLPRFLMVSVDPRRDTPERLRQYVRHFHPAFRGATGEDTALGALTRQLGGVYLRHDEEQSSNYLVDHSAAIWLLNPRAEYHALFTPPHDPQRLAHDFRVLATTYQETL